MDPVNTYNAKNFTSAQTQENISQVLSVLVPRASADYYTTATAGRSDSAIWGLAQCRSDIPASNWGLARETARFGATSTTIYEFGWCTRDISAADCGLCVAQEVAEAKLAVGRVGAGRYKELNILERIVDGIEEPGLLDLSLLQRITENFSDKTTIGSGGYGVVYKGILRNGAVAVKKLNSNQTITEKMFHREVQSLITVKHQNIIRFLGFCSFTEEHVIPSNGELITVNILERLLCLEYISNGSLESHCTDELKGLEWHTRYQIIKGICKGLLYLHKEKGIIHMDLKPANILLDDYMVPKITDFGLATHDNQTTIATLRMSQGYCAPEYISQGKMSSKSDIYSLGKIILELVTGSKEEPDITKVHENWSNTLGTSLGNARLEQVIVCAEIGIQCIDSDPDKRPDTQCIIEKLEETESMGVFTEAEETESMRVLFTEAEETGSMGVFTEAGMSTSLVVQSESVDDVKALNVQQEEKASNDLQQATPTTTGETSSEVMQRSQEIYAPTVREDSRDMELNILQRIVDGVEEPSHLELPLLQRITENFSDKTRIGSGGCGVIYKGILRNGAVAVKKLSNSQTITDKMFHREVESLITVNHQNIVRFLGYCSFTVEHAMPWKGEIIMVNIRERLLCLEYISNGSLERHCTDELRGLEWHTRYQIVMGICKGLLYLHKEKGIVHMDLKPANILLDDDMVPKITDFGLSRLDNTPQATTTTRRMSPGYCAPEYISQGKMSSKSDIYSLGKIIMELVTGSKEEPDITKVLRRWRHRWIKSLRYTPLVYQQVKKCLELALRCMQHDPEGRPDISHIIDELNKIESSDMTIQIIPCLDDMLGIEPLEVNFPFALDQQMSCSIELANNTDDYIAFMITKANLRQGNDYIAFMHTKANLRQFHTQPNKGIVPPQSKCSVTVTIPAQDKTLLQNHYKGELTVQSTRIDGSLGTMDITGDVFIEKEGKVVDEVNVMVVIGTAQLSE